MPNPIIEVKNVRKVFKIKQRGTGFFGSVQSLFAARYKDIIAVDDISFSVDEGEIVAFIGPNGAGKSTTIKMLTGIMLPTSGSINILGYVPSYDRTKLAYHIGTVFGQKAQLWYHLPPLDTFDLFSRIYELDQTAYKKRLQFLIESFEIQSYIDVPVRKLSLGQRMRCELVASLIHQPKILFLDEPTIGLDVIAKQQVRDVIRFLNDEEKVTIFLTSHDAGDIESLAKRAIVINYGTVIFDDTTPMLKKRYITTKMVELFFEDEGKEFVFEGGRVVDAHKHYLKIEVNTSVAAIEKVLSYALEHFHIRDITIVEPPLEEIISAIYREPR
jgi:ABC-2 type transport system ATP-binding protein